MNIPYLSYLTSCLVKMKAMEDIPLENFCQANPLVNKFFWPENIAYENFKHFCEIVNGMIYNIVADMVNLFLQNQILYNL